MVDYKIWIVGSPQPIEIALDGDVLQEDFIEWVMAENPGKKGFVCKTEGKTRVLDFRQVAYMEVRPRPEGGFKVTEDPSKFSQAYTP